MINYRQLKIEYLYVLCLTIYFATLFILMKSYLYMENIVSSILHFISLTFFLTLKWRLNM